MMKVPRGRGALPENYPNGFLDSVIREQQLKNDAELSRLLQLAPSSISKIRHGRAEVSAEVLLRVHEAFGTPIAELKRRQSSGVVNH